MSPPPALCNLFVRTVVKVCSLGFRDEVGFLNCDSICMCVVNKQFELLEFVFDSVYVDLQYDEIALPFPAGSMVVSGLSVRSLWYPMWLRWLLCLLIVSTFYGYGESLPPISSFFRPSFCQSVCFWILWCDCQRGCLNT